jgi:hypothetical protein
MALPELYRCARSLEAIENYSLADKPLFEEPQPPGGINHGGYPFTQDRDFWYKVFEDVERNNPGKSMWGAGFSFYRFAISEWVGRVPGLFWTKGADKLRKLADRAVQYESKGWKTLHPYGKSEKVVGGIGTLKIPPSEREYRLITLSAGHNASSGIPALVSPEVWEGRKLKEGHVINFTARWQPMTAEWASRFPSIKGIPRGYLVLSDPAQIQNVSDVTTPTQIHPFTVMEYTHGNAILFDFVFATADTAGKHYRKELEGFFDGYKRDAGRDGRYLLSADINNPLWDAEYDSPAALRGDAGAQAQLGLLEARVRQISFKGKSLTAILDFLTDNYDDVSMRRISDAVGIPPAQWYASGISTAALAARFLDKCVKREKVEVLLDAVALDDNSTLLARKG